MYFVLAEQYFLYIMNTVRDVVVVIGAYDTLWRRLFHVLPMIFVQTADDRFCDLPIKRGVQYELDPKSGMVNKSS